ncbi:MAG: sulfite exporter TauE/SafE family protein, partial [Polaromonas sp.]|nr:sulfite exporter TauE/SafE family protein [Polaromonas sp.]
ALVALGSSVSLLIGPWLFLRLHGSGSGEWGIRLAGMALALTSGWALWMGLAHNAAPWCVTP